MGLNAKDYATGEWLKKADLKRGPLCFVIVDVEERPGRDWGDGKPVRPELVLVLEGGKRFPLRVAMNLDRVRDAWGDECELWKGRVVEIYFNPDVPNPRGGEPGGLRVRIPTASETSGVAAPRRVQIELPDEEPVL